MPDREKVIEGITVCFTPNSNCKDCPYDCEGKVPNCTKALGKDTLALLEEQEAVVRCKDCKHRGDRHKCIVAFVAEKQEMPYFFYDNRGNWFCADGERRAENED